MECILNWYIVVAERVYDYESLSTTKRIYWSGAGLRWRWRVVVKGCGIFDDRFMTRDSMYPSSQGDISALGDTKITIPFDEREERV